MNFFGNHKTEEQKRNEASEQCKQWKRNLQKESNRIERDIKSLERAEEKAARECKKLAQGGNMKAARIMAKEIVNTRKHIEGMYKGKAQLGSVQFSLQNSMSMLKMQGIMGKSVDILHAMNDLVKLPELSDTMRTMAREMERAGLIDEMVSDALDSQDSAGLDAEADAQVDKVITELTAGILDRATAAPTAAVPQKVAPASVAASLPEAPVGGDDELQAMRARLQAL